MAIDVYLQIDGIKGESQDDKHKDWIECVSVNWGIRQPRSATASTSGGHTAERAELREIAFSKLADLSSPILMQYCAMGKTIPKGMLEFMRADGSGNPIRYFEIELENVLIGAVEPSIEPGTILDEHVSLKYSKTNGAIHSRKSVAAVAAARSVAGTWLPTASRHNRASLPRCQLESGPSRSDSEAPCIPPSKPPSRPHA